MALIELKDVSKTYGHGNAKTPVLHGISLSIEKGEFIAMIGASGSGKTTLMNIIGLLDTPDSGTYHLEETDMNSLKDKDRARYRRERIGFIFQNFNLIRRLNALGNVELPMIYDKVPPKDRRFHAQRLLRLVGLGDRMKYRPNQLSGGQMQRVAIARSLANRPKIILADEPTGNLDSRTGQTIMKVLSKLHKRGNTIVVITHDPEVAKYADREIHLTDGYLHNPKAATPKEPAEAQK